MAMEIDNAGSDDKATRIKHPLAITAAQMSNFDDFTVLDADVRFIWGY
jgi:hypothetical protein